MRTRLQLAKLGDNPPSIPESMISATNGSKNNNETNKDGQTESKKTVSPKSSEKMPQVQSNQQNITQSEETPLQSMKAKSGSKVVSSAQKPPQKKLNLKSIAKPSRNPYINFIQAFTSELKEKNILLHGKEFVLRCSSKWKSLTESEKQPYIEFARTVPHKKVTVKRKSKKRNNKRYENKESNTRYSQSDSSYCSTFTTSPSLASSYASTYKTAESYTSETSY